MSGVFAGVLSNTISHPLDTIKLRIQLHRGSEPLKLRACMRDIYYFEGLKGFYKGLLSPVVGRAPIAAMYVPNLNLNNPHFRMFSGNGYAKRKLENVDVGVNAKNFMAGFFAGL